MQAPLSTEETEHYQGLKTFARQHVAPYAARWEQAQGFPREAADTAGKQGLLGATVPIDHGGLGWNATQFGLLTEALARHSSSFAALFNVHTMVQQSILRWGTPAQKGEFLPQLASSEKLAAICFTEPHAGSDLAAMKTTFRDHGNTLEIIGSKKWITCAAIADILLVFGKLDEKPAAALIDRTTPGIKITPQRDMLGFRAANLADIEFDHCRFPRERLLGRPGTALQFIAPYALDWGRLSVAWSCLGMLRGCTEETADFVLSRKASDVLLVEQGSLQGLITDMNIQSDAALLLTLQATRSKDDNHPQAPDDMLAAKYFTSRTATKQASIAVQLMGARGCEESSPVARHYRDSKIMEIIEGSSQIIERLLAKRYALRRSTNK